MIEPKHLLDVTPEMILAVRQNQRGEVLFSLQVENMDVLEISHPEIVRVLEQAGRDNKFKSRSVQRLFRTVARAQEVETTFYDWVTDEVLDLFYNYNFKKGRLPIALEEMEKANQLAPFARAHYLVDLLARLAMEEFERVGLKDYPRQRNDGSRQVQRATMPKREREDLGERIDVEFRRHKSLGINEDQEIYQKMAETSKSALGLSMSARVIEGRHYRWKKSRGIIDDVERQPQSI